MLGVFDLEIHIAVEMVGKKPQSQLEGDQPDCVVQIAVIVFGQETLGDRQIPLQNRLAKIGLETDIIYLLRLFTQRAIQAEKDGLEVEFTEKDNLDYPDELLDALDDDRELTEAFKELTPGRQRGWVLHFSDAKQSQTRARRIDKARSKIIAGKGWNEP